MLHQKLPHNWAPSILFDFHDVHGRQEFLDIDSEIVGSREHDMLAYKGANGWVDADRVTFGGKAVIEIDMQDVVDRIRVGKEINLVYRIGVGNRIGYEIQVGAIVIAAGCGNKTSFEINFNLTWLFK